MDLSVGSRQRWIAQINLIRQVQVWQSAVGGRAQIEEHGVDLAVLKLSEVKLVHLLRVGLAPQEARFEIGETIVPLSKLAHQQRVVAHWVEVRVVSPDLYSGLEEGLIPGDRSAARLLEVGQEPALGAVGQYDGVAGEDHEPPDRTAVGRLQQNPVHLGICAQVHITARAPLFKRHGECDRMPRLALECNATPLVQCWSEFLTYER